MFQFLISSVTMHFTDTRKFTFIKTKTASIAQFEEKQTIMFCRPLFQYLKHINLQLWTT